jgi:hypothetical protein
MRGRFVFAVVAVALSMACASSGGGGAGGSRTSSGGQDVITEADITGRAADAANALQIIQKLRPQMLRNRGLAVLPTPASGASPGRTAEEAAAASLPRVYIDNIAYGDLGQLTNVNASQIREIRYINSRDATTQWGTGHMGGVILVLTKK